MINHAEHSYVDLKSNYFLDDDIYISKNIRSMELAIKDKENIKNNVLKLNYGVKKYGWVAFGKKIDNDINIKWS